MEMRSSISKYDCLESTEELDEIPPFSPGPTRATYLKSHQNWYIYTSGGKRSAEKMEAPTAIRVFLLLLVFPGSLHSEDLGPFLGLCREISQRHGRFRLLQDPSIVRTLHRIVSLGVTFPLCLRRIKEANISSQAPQSNSACFSPGDYESGPGTFDLIKMQNFSRILHLFEMRFFQ